MNVKQKTISGIKWTSLSTFINNLLQSIFIIVMAKWFLSVGEWAVFGLVMVIVEFSNYFVDMGITNAIIHKKIITEEQLSSLYWLNIITGFAIFIILFLISSLIGSLYKIPELSLYIRVMAIMFIITPIGQQFKTLMQKELMFDLLSKIDIIARVVSFVVGIVFAVLGFRIYSLIAMALTGVLINSFLLLLNENKYYKPKLLIKFKSIKEFYSFGAYQMIDRSLNYWSSQFDVLLIVYFLGKESSGIYIMAKI